MNIYNVQFKVSLNGRHSEMKMDAPTALVAFCKVALYIALHYDAAITLEHVSLLENTEFSVLVSDMQQFDAGFIFEEDPAIERMLNPLSTTPNLSSDD